MWRDLSMTFDEPIRIISDIHFGHPASLVLKPEQIIHPFTFCLRPGSNRPRGCGIGGFLAGLDQSIHFGFNIADRILLIPKYLNTTIKKRNFTLTLNHNLQ